MLTECDPCFEICLADEVICNKNSRIRKVLAAYEKMHMRKVLVYTAIENEYDSLSPTPYGFNDFHYVCFSNTIRKKYKNGWQIIKNPSAEKSAVLKCRDVKINPHKYLSNYEYSIWVDGSVVLSAEFLKYILNCIVKKDTIIFVKHRVRSCVYEEAEACRRSLKENDDIIERQVKVYLEDGYPEKNGLVETGVMLRKHSEISIQEVMDLWWSNIKSHSHRDQLSVNYCLWKKSVDYKLMPGTMSSNNPGFIVQRHRGKMLANWYFFLEARVFQGKNLFYPAYVLLGWAKKIKMLIKL